MPLDACARASALCFIGVATSSFHYTTIDFPVHLAVVSSLHTAAVHFSLIRKLGGAVASCSLQ